MKFLVTGAGGQLGLELIKQLKNTEHSYQGVGHKEMDITRYDECEKVIDEYRPDVVVNCAAHTKVDLCETDIENAYRINAIGPKNLAMLSKKMDFKLVHISTDYVFDGEKEIPRREDDETHPVSIYGKSKLYGEEMVRQFAENYFIIRTAWLYGDGNNFVRTMLKLSKDHKELNVVNDQIGNPTYTKDLALAVRNLSETEYYGTYHGTCNGSCSWNTFAKKIFELMNIRITVNEVDSSAFVRPAKRPAFSKLDNFMLRLYDLDTFRNWEEALEDYLKEDQEWQSINL